MILERLAEALFPCCREVRRLRAEKERLVEHNKKLSDALRKKALELKDCQRTLKRERRRG